MHRMSKLVPGDFLDLAFHRLGNQLYDVDGDHVSDLRSLFALHHSEPTGEASLQSLLGVSEASLNAAANDAVILNLDSDDSQLYDDVLVSETDASVEDEVHMEQVPSTSRSNRQSNEITKILLQNIPHGEKLFSTNINDRLSYILQEAVYEYNRMKAKYKEMKKGEFCRSEFQCQQHESLVAESNDLIQFLKLVAEEGTNPPDIRDRIIKDILTAENFIT